MPVAKDIIQETSTIEGTGNATLAGVDGRVRFSDATHGFGTGGTDAFRYWLLHRSAGEWERGTGHMSDANTLVRDTVEANHLGTTALVNFTVGTKDVTHDEPAEFHLSTLLTTRGDLPVRGANDPERLAIGTAGQVLTSDGTDPVWVSDYARIKTGTYTGDGTTSQAITGIGFQPKQVRIHQRQTTETSLNFAYTIDVMNDDMANGAAIVGSNNNQVDNRIIALGSDGFTVDDDGTDAMPNGSGIIYNFIAIG